MFPTDKNLALPGINSAQNQLPANNSIPTSSSNVQRQPDLQFVQDLQAPSPAPQQLRQFLQVQNSSSGTSSSSNLQRQPDIQFVHDLQAPSPSPQQLRQFLQVQNSIARGAHGTHGARGQASNGAQGGPIRATPRRQEQRIRVEDIKQELPDAGRILGRQIKMEEPDAAGQFRNFPYRPIPTRVFERPIKIEEPAPAEGFPGFPLNQPQVNAPMIAPGNPFLNFPLNLGALNGAAPVLPPHLTPEHLAAIPKILNPEYEQHPYFSYPGAKPLDPSIAWTAAPKLKVPVIPGESEELTMFRFKDPRFILMSKEELEAEVEKIAKQPPRDGPRRFMEENSTILLAQLYCMSKKSSGAPKTENP